MMVKCLCLILKLFAMFSIEICKQNPFSDTHTHLGNERMVEFLIKNGADVNTKDTIQDITPLIQAIQNGMLE